MFMPFSKLEQQTTASKPVVCCNNLSVTLPNPSGIGA
jgi:hypothetical protein